MHIAAVILARCVLVLLSLVQIAIFARVIMSFFTMEEDSRILVFLVLITEPVILPVRLLLARLHLFEESPFDVAMMFTFLLLSVISMILPTVA